MTPYAVLLINPDTASDATVRASYHILAAANHPDANTEQAGSTLWYTATTAYTAIKTGKARAIWLAFQQLHSGLCSACKGYGVTSLRGGKASVCAACAGRGRAQKKRQ